MLGTTVKFANIHLINELQPRESLIFYHDIWKLILLFEQYVKYGLWQKCCRFATAWWVKVIRLSFGSYWLNFRCYSLKKCIHSSDTFYFLLRKKYYNVSPKSSRTREQGFFFIRHRIIIFKLFQIHFAVHDEFTHVNTNTE